MSTNVPVQTIQGQSKQPAVTPVIEPRTPGLMVFNHEYRRSAKKRAQLSKEIKKSSPFSKSSKIMLLLCLIMAVQIVVVGIVLSVLEQNAAVFLLTGVAPLMFCSFALICALAVLPSSTHAVKAEKIGDPRILMNDYGFSYSRYESGCLENDRFCCRYYFIDNVAFKDIIAINHYAKTGAYEILCKADKYVYPVIENASRRDQNRILDLLPDGVNAPLPPVARGQQILPVQRVLFEERIKIYDFFKGEPFKAIAQGAGIVINECEPLGKKALYQPYEGPGKEIGVGLFSDAEYHTPPEYVSQARGVFIMFWIFFGITAGFSLVCGKELISLLSKPPVRQADIVDHLDESECYFTKEDIDHVGVYLDEKIDEEFTYDLLNNDRITLKNGEEVITSVVAVTYVETGKEVTWIATKYITQTSTHDMGEIKVEID